MSRLHTRHLPPRRGGICREDEQFPHARLHTARSGGGCTLDDVTLTTTEHDRGAAGLTYVYPVVSRRARGVSVGVNLNPNKACNWRCIYCQVPGLARGKGPPIDIPRLRSELRGLLTEIVRGDFLARNA